MKDLTNKFGSVAIRVKDGKELIKRKHSTEHKAQKDVDLMKESSFFDPNKYKAIVRPI